MDLRRLFEKPLILGASVSAGYFCDGPATLLAKKYGSPHPKIIASSGMKAKDLFASQSPKVLMGHSAIFALDMFFWDSTLRTLEPSYVAMKTLAAASASTPLIVGDVPAFFPAYQPSVGAINSKIKEEFSGLPNAVIVPLFDLHQRLLRDKFFLFKDQRMGLSDFMPDGLHVGAHGSQFLADFVESRLKAADKN